MPCASAAAQKNPLLSPYVLSGLPIGTGRVYSPTAWRVIVTLGIPRRPRKIVLNCLEIVTSRRRSDSGSMAVVTVVPVPVVKPFLVASDLAFAEAVVKSPGMYGTPASAPASAASWTWSDSFHQLPTSTTRPMSPNSSPIDIANMIRIWPRPRRRTAARASGSSERWRRSACGKAVTGSARDA